MKGERKVGIKENKKVEFIEEMERELGLKKKREKGNNVMGDIGEMMDGKEKDFVEIGGNLESEKKERKII